MVLPGHFHQGDPGGLQAFQHGPVGLAHLLLLFLGGDVRLVPLRLRDGGPGDRRERVLGVVPQLEAPLVPVIVRAGQHCQDIVVAAALLHLKAGVADRCRAGVVP
jgi:hypothetical protein